MKSIKQRVCECIKKYSYLSACQVGRALGVKYSTTSSYLYDWVLEGKMGRLAGLGPRGGYVYFVKKGKKRKWKKRNLEK